MLYDKIADDRILCRFGKEKTEGFCNHNKKGLEIEGHTVETVGVAEETFR